MGDLVEGLKLGGKGGVLSYLVGSSLEDAGALVDGVGPQPVLLTLQLLRRAV